MVRENPHPSAANSADSSDASQMDAYSSVQSTPEVALQSHQTVWPPGAKTSSWRWLIVGLVGCSIFGGISTLAWSWLMMLPPIPNCGQLSSLATDREQLHCAQKSAQSDDLPEVLAGLELLGQWTPGDPLYQEAQTWLASWSKSVLATAQQKNRRGDLAGALALARQIPPSSPVYTEAEAAIASWQQQLRQVETRVAKAEAALQRQAWGDVSEQIQALRQLRDHGWGVKQANHLSRQLAVEKRARQQLVQAEKSAHGRPPKQLGAAIQLASQIDADTYTWVEAQPKLQKWGETLLAIGWQRWQAKQLDVAILQAEQVALVPNLAVAAQDLSRLSQARQLAIATDINWQPAAQHLWQLMEAIAIARQVKPDSQFYAAAQASLKSWELQLQDVTRLQLAQTTANLNLRSAFKWAIAQAQQIEPDRPKAISKGAACCQVALTKLGAPSA
ncbi:MAG: hypothetical protein F6K19_24520, partial [Cyanothece sp. SIO1E1]|nr:hypothetical protein [Cyanothece sp. SIO1E1]